MRDSILYAGLRALIVAFFVIIGIIAAFVVAILFFSLFGEGDYIERNYSPQILANAKGVRKQLSKEAPVILELSITGTIGSESMNMDDVRQMLQESREGFLKNDRVKAILLRLDTPGGTVTDADSIYRQLKAYKARYKVPIIAYVDGMAASGGMYVSAAADEIYASDVSMIGSIGVLSPPFFNAVKLMDKIGVDSVTITAGKNKDEFNPFRPWKEDEGANVKDMIQKYYIDFVDIMVAARPKLNKEALIQDYGANVYIAKDAAEKGYIDGAGYSYDDALKLLLKKISIEDDYYQVVKLEQAWYATLFKTNSNSLMKGKVTHEFNIGDPFRPELMGKFLYLYIP